MKVLSIKLVTGEELVARVTSEGEHSITIESPQVLQVQQAGGGQLALAFVPWTLSNPDAQSIMLQRANIVAMFAPSDKVEKQYLTQTSKILMG